MARIGNAPAQVGWCDPAPGLKVTNEQEKARRQTRAALTYPAPRT